MPLSKTEERTLYDSIYTDLLDLRDDIKELLQGGASMGSVLNKIDNAKDTIPRKTVRLLKQTSKTKQL
jgi:hypothetical protein